MESTIPKKCNYTWRKRRGYYTRLQSIQFQESRMSTAEELHHWNATSPCAYLQLLAGRKCCCVYWPASELELTMLKRKSVKSTSKKVTEVHRLDVSYERRLLKPLPFQSTLSTVSCCRRECWMKFLYISKLLCVSACIWVRIDNDEGKMSQEHLQEYYL